MSPEFNLDTISDRLDRRRKSRGRWVLGFVTFIVALAALIIGLTIPRIIAGSGSPILVAGMAIYASLAGFSLYMSLPRIRKTSPAPRAILVDSAGFVLRGPGNASRTTLWSDPALSVDLYDFSSVDRERWVVGTPFLLVTQHVHVGLTEPAYRELIAQAESHSVVWSEPSGALGSSRLAGTIRTVIRQRGKPPGQRQ